SDGGDGVGALVHAPDVEPVPHQVEEVASVAAAGIKDAHAVLDPAPVQLIEHVDVDVAELGLEAARGFPAHVLPPESLGATARSAEIRSALILRATGATGASGSADRRPRSTRPRAGHRDRRASSGGSRPW